jgi:hypothetical protein
MIQAVRLFEIFKIQFTDEQAKFIVEEVVKMEAEVEPKIEKIFDQRKDVLATKSDIANVKEEIANVRLEIATVKIEMAVGFNRILVWIVGTMIAMTAIAITISKLVH